MNRVTPSNRLKTRSDKKNNKIRLERNRISPSRYTSLLEVLTAEIMATPPRIKPRLNMLLPTILPTEISACSRIAANVVTANSGAEVPNATIVRPIMISEIPSFSAIAEADSTSHRAPHHKAKILNITVTISRIICMSHIVISD